MRKAQPNESETKRRMLEVAAALLAEHGFEVVSVRDVTQSAKVNVAAVNYHFGSRDGLMARVMEEAVRHFNEERLARLEGLEKRFTGKPAPLEEVLEAWLKPLASAAQRSNWKDPVTAPLIGRVLTLPADKVPSEISQTHAGIDDRVRRLLGKTLTPLSVGEISWRMHGLLGALAHTLVSPTVSGLLDAASVEAIMARFVKFAAAAMREGAESLPPAKKSPQATFDF
jgi:AcrR family transcriptional regulator